MPISQSVIRIYDPTTSTFVTVLSGGALKIDGSAVTQPVSAVSLPLPTGAATSAAQTDGTMKARTLDTAGVGITSTLVSTKQALDVNVVQTVGGGSGGVSQADKSTFTEGTTTFTPVGGTYNESVTADPTEDQAAAVRITAKRGMHANLRTAAGVEIGVSAAPVRTDPTGTTTQPVSAASLPLPAGASTETTLAALNTKIPASLTVTSTRLLVDGSGVTQPVSAASLPLPTGAATEATLAAMSAKLTASSATLASLTAAATTAVALAANAARKGVIAINDGTANCYLAFAATASTTAFSVKLAPGSQYEMSSPIYTGAISAIWDVANGALRSTELS